MKTYSQFLIVTAVLMYFFLFPKLTISQTTNNAEENNLFKRYWSIDLNAGANLFWGDLRQNSFVPITKNENEWQLGYGLIVNRQISPVFGLRVQLLNGKLSGTKRKINRYFTADIFEYNLNTTVNFSNLFFHYKPERLLKVYGTIGVGFTNWRTKVMVLGTNKVISEDGFGNGSGLWGRTLEGVIPIGLGIDFHLNDNWAMNLEGTLHGVNSDELDMTVSGSKFDMYSYTSLGVTYKFNKRRKRYVYKKESGQEYPDAEISSGLEGKFKIISEMPKMIYSGDDFIVKLNVKKDITTQGGKIIQYFPEGFFPTKTTLTNGNFIFEERTLTINFENLPESTMFTTSYKVLTDNLPTYNYLIIGKLIYNYQNKEKSIDFENIIKIEQKSDKIIEDEKIILDEKITEAKVEKIIEDKKVGEEQKEILVEEKVVEIPQIFDIEYRVQIRAKYGEKLPKTWLANKYNLKQEIKEDFYNGYYIYTLGSFPSFETAQKYCNSLMSTNKIKGPFVVAFKSGKRIEIDELFIEKKDAPIISASGIEYRVQIRAKFGEKVSKTWLANKYNLKQEIKENLNNGYYIYTLGSFKTYEAARKYRDELRLNNKINGAFVVAFRNGKRYNSLNDIKK
ncbi:MAG: hypothetical protein JEY97_03735 [Bacteroidales bacterium]|nr:hypothetical protein [Bacteroidales bacterium]